jgi:hypothetical protein
MIRQLLESLVASEKKFRQKGGLCVGLVLTKAAKEKGLPLDPETLRTEQEGQVAGLGLAQVQSILNSFGITKVLAKEGGRTSRGSLGLMRKYIDVLNSAHNSDCADLEDAMNWWIERVYEYFASEGPKFQFDPGMSVTTNLDRLFEQALEIQSDGGGTNYVGAMLQHLVGAKIDIVLGPGQIKHHGFSVADGPTQRPGDFHLHGIAIHVTTHPTEALISKVGDNIQHGLKPVIVTLNGKVAGTRFLVDQSSWAGRVDVLDAGQFLMANVYERSLFKATECKATLTGIITRYNEIVAECETDPVLKIRF